MTCSSGNHDGPVPGAVNVARVAEKDQIQKAFRQNNLGGANQLYKSRCHVPLNELYTCSSGDHDGPVPGAVKVACVAEKDQIQKAFRQSNLGGANQL